MTPNWPWMLNNDKCSADAKDLPLRPKYWSILLYNYWFSRYKVARKLEMHRMAPNWTGTLNSKNIPYTCTLITYPWYPNFGPFGFTISRFRDTTCTRSAKIGNVPNYSKLTWGPNVGPFWSTISDFQDTRSSKISNAPNDQKPNLNI